MADCRSPHILIIGGGVIGTSIAYHLSIAGARVTLIEAGDLASGSSGACDGHVFMQSKKPGIHLELALESSKKFSDLAQTLPIDIEYTQNGGLVLIETEDEFQAMEAFVVDQRQAGLRVQLLKTTELLKKEPCLSDRLLGATYSPLDAQVNPINLTLGFALAAGQHHARIITGSPVTAIEVRNRGIIAVVTDQETFNPDIVVNAAGSKAGLIADLMGMAIPVKPRKGQIAVTQPTRPLVSHNLISAKYIAAKYHPELARQNSQGISLEQTAKGNLLLGSTREFAGFDTTNTPEGIQSILSHTTSVLPSLLGLQIIRTFAGLRPYTPDGLPLLGPAAALDNVFMAAGHEGDGIALSPITGDIMAKLILGKKTGFDLTPFSPDRFHQKDVQSHG